MRQGLLLCVGLTLTSACADTSNSSGAGDGLGDQEGQQAIPLQQGADEEETQEPALGESGEVIAIDPPRVLSDDEVAALDEPSPGADMIETAKDALKSAFPENAQVALVRVDAAIPRLALPTEEHFAFASIVTDYQLTVVDVLRGDYSVSTMAFTGYGGTIGTITEDVSAAIRMALDKHYLLAFVEENGVVVRLRAILSQSDGSVLVNDVLLPLSDVLDAVDTSEVPL